MTIASSPTGNDAGATLLSEADRATMAAVRAQFPLLTRDVRGKPLAYFDSGATAQKPQVVIDTISRYYERHNANVHRGAHLIAEEATALFEAAREKVCSYINAPALEEVIWTRGTTESINLVAASFGHDFQAGDEILVSELEHHSNIVPWQLLAQRSGARVVVLPVSATGELDLELMYQRLGARTRLVAVNHISNALGTINPLSEIIDAAHAVGAKVLIDGAQALPHLRVDMTALDADFYAFSGHKMFGPTGIGVLWGKAELLSAMPPYQSGGEMIEQVSFDGTTFNRLPFKFEAGTPHIAGALGMAAAVDFLVEQDAELIARHEQDLTSYLIAGLSQFEEVRLVGTPSNRASVVSFIVDGAHPNDVGTLLDQQGIAVRTGHHCAMPLMQRLSPQGTVRASMALYNSREDIDQLLQGLRKTLTFL